MYGPPQVPQPPRSPASGGRIALRFLFCALALLSCGFLAWAPMLRLAVVTRRTADWVLCALTFLAGAGLFAYAAATGDQEVTTAESFVALGVITVLVAGPVTYYLIGEIRHAERRRAEGTAFGHDPRGYAFGTAVTVPSGSVPGAGPNPYTVPVTPASATPAPVTPAPRPAPRIEQVRAELDELSDLLRKEPREDEGGR
ncbi:hypothetical protein [Streptomyces sp. NPDC001744]|uniref:hypothetical protein n=1 Tax=Streptomyces sp. NPDC001744 TaxID=3364606 RepID=UPI0036AEDB08